MLLSFHFPHQIPKNRAIVSDPPRPVNSVKIYGGARHGAGVEEGTRKFWRNILGGLASSRFHRPVAENLQSAYLIYTGREHTLSDNTRALHFTQIQNVFEK